VGAREARRSGKEDEKKTRCTLLSLRLNICDDLDRNNIAAAKLRGLEDDLNLSQVSRSTNVVVFLRISDSEPP
jgi:hypothetical protein